MKTTKTRFKCDFCDKKSREILNNSSYPYDDSWIYLFKMNIKIGFRRIDIDDKHFCSVKCLNNYLAKVIEEARKSRERMDYKEWLNEIESEEIE